MIASKDMYFVPQRIERSSELLDTFVKMLCFILAVINVIVSIYYFPLDISTVAFMLQSGKIPMAIGFAFVGIIKHVCQLIWILQFFTTIQFVVDFGKFVCAGALVILGSCLGIFIVLLLGESKSWIEVLMHPFVVEYGTFVIANVFMTMYLFKIIKYYYVMPGFNYAPVPQVQQQVQMKPIMMPQNYQYAYSLYP